jgi:alkyl sulfatase BDS1-like metallo-beta-lactamase superfamily hydrolase
MRGRCLARPHDAEEGRVCSANKAFAGGRDLASAQETDFATRGFIAALEDLEIKDAKGQMVLSMPLRSIP